MNGPLKAALGAVLLAVCQASSAFVLQRHMSDIDPVPEGFTTRQIFFQAEQSLAFGLVLNNKEVVLDAYEGLMRQCDGRITGISTTLVRKPQPFHYKNVIEIHGLCIEPLTAENTDQN